MNPRRTKWALPLLMFLAVPAQAEPGEQAVSLSATAFTYASYNRTSPLFTGLELAYHRPGRGEGLWRWLRFGGGLRTALPTRDIGFSVEGFVQAQLAMRIGIWEASTGPELGLSGFARLQRPRTRATEELDLRENALLGPVYLAFATAPLRLHLGRFEVSALEFHVGTSAPSVGVALRLQLGLLRVGFAL